MQPILNRNISMTFLVKYTCNMSKSKLVFPLSNESYFGLIAFTRLEVITNQTGVLFLRHPVFLRNSVQTLAKQKLSAILLFWFCQPWTITNSPWLRSQSKCRICNSPWLSVYYLTIRQRGRVVYELIVNEGAARVDYLFRDNEAELSNCFSIHSYLILPKIQIVRDIEKIAPKITVKSLWMYSLSIKE